MAADKDEAEFLLCLTLSQKLPANLSHFAIACGVAIDRFHAEVATRGSAFSGNQMAVRPCCTEHDQQDGQRKNYRACFIYFQVTQCLANGC